jgi:hypothetical protein
MRKDSAYTGACAQSGIGCAMVSAGFCRPMIIAIKTASAGMKGEQPEYEVFLHEYAYGQYFN